MQLSQQRLRSHARRVRAGGLAREGMGWAGLGRRASAPRPHLLHHLQDELLCSLRSRQPCSVGDALRTGGTTPISQPAPARSIGPPEAIALRQSDGAASAAGLRCNQSEWMILAGGSLAVRRCV